jgi:hypothetical protein
VRILSEIPKWIQFSIQDSFSNVKCFSGTLKIPRQDSPRRRRNEKGLTHFGGQPSFGSEAAPEIIIKSAKNEGLTKRQRFTKQSKTNAPYNTVTKSKTETER